MRSFESYSTAEKHASNRIDKENKGLAKKKNHTGNLDKMTWNKESLISEINTHLENETKVASWSELARKYNITDKTGKVPDNGGQIAKEYIKSTGINVDLVSYERNNGNTIVRKRKRRLPGKEISVPTECTNAKLKEKIKEKIKSGEYSVGEAIPSKKIKKFTVKNNEMKEEIIETEGRKFSLEYIRQKSLKRYEIFMRSQPPNYYDSISDYEVKEKLEKIQEYNSCKSSTENRDLLKLYETTRNFQIWHDASTIGMYKRNIVFKLCVFTYTH